MAPSVRNLAFFSHFRRTRRSRSKALPVVFVGLIVALAGIAHADLDARPEMLIAETSFDVGLAIVSASGMVGAVQFDIVYTGKSGGFVPQFNETRGACQVSVPKAFGVSNVREDGRITVGIAGAPGFETPVKLVDCKFSSDGPVTIDDFKIFVVDVIDSTGTYMKRAPEIRVTTVAAQAVGDAKVGNSAENADIDRLAADSH